MKSITANLVCLFISFYCSGQNLPKEYTDLIKRADSLFLTKNYIESANTFSFAFKTLGWKGLGEDRYKAARSWALAGNSDSAVFNLERIATALYFSEYKQIFSDSAFLSLHYDKRWLPLLELIKNNQKKEELNPNLSLTDELEIIYSDDQKYRKMLDTIPHDSKNREAVIKLIGEKDHYNLNQWYEPQGKHWTQGSAASREELTSQHSSAPWRINVLKRLSLANNLADIL